MGLCHVALVVINLINLASSNKPWYVIECYNECCMKTEVLTKSNRVLTDLYSHNILCHGNAYQS